MRSFHAVLLAVGTLMALLAGCTSNEKPKEPTTAAGQASNAPLTVQDSVDVSLTARVKAIDYVTRVVTLQDAAGHEVTFVVDPIVQRLNEVKVGDNVSTRYRASLVAELRAPTVDEAADPIALVTIGGRATQGADPAGAVAQGVRVVTTVAAVDLPNMLVTLRGPMGDLAVVHARKPENVKRLKVGDTIVITYTESVAVSLEKATAR